MKLGKNAAMSRTNRTYRAFASTKWLLAVVIIVAGGLVSGLAAGADSEAAARKQAAKANQLAAKNKCKQALPWFNRAYRTLKDPTLLFNRAECLRKLGEKSDAVRDYELFLTEMPAAPNRTLVEERIASLLEAIKAEPPPVGASPTEDKASAGPTATPGKTPEKPAVTSGEQGTAPTAKPAEQAPAEPVRRAEKWTD
jgi:tetratricopeptide (TPR) repeat protein